MYICTSGLNKQTQATNICTLINRAHRNQFVLQLPNVEILPMDVWVLQDYIEYEEWKAIRFSPRKGKINSLLWIVSP